MSRRRPCLALLLAWTYHASHPKPDPARPRLTVPASEGNPAHPPRWAHSLGSGVVELVLPGAAEAGLHAVVGPEPPDNAGQVLGEHALLLGRAGQRKQLPGVVLGTAGESAVAGSTLPHLTRAGGPGDRA